MRLLKESGTFTHRQSFCGMIQSLFCHENPELIGKVIVKNFIKDIEDLSKDKVVNVRISLAEAFYKLAKKYEAMEVMLSDRNISIKTKAEIQVNIETMTKIMNKHFFRALQNLKYDKSELVQEYLENLYVNPNDEEEQDLDILAPPETQRQFSIISKNSDKNSDFGKRTFSVLIPDEMQRSASVTSDLLDFTDLDGLPTEEPPDDLAVEYIDKMIQNISI